MKMKHFIDVHKGVTGLFVLGIMMMLDQWHNPTLWLYLALHGVYGLLWVIKSRIFPDSTWEKRVSVLYGVVVIWGGLSLYWVAPVLLAWRGVQAPGWYQAACAAMYTAGIFLHFAADMQKHTQLRLCPERLITDGLYARVRNPNYFGELLIYLGFGLLAMHWLPVLLLALFVGFYWLPNMWRKDRSLSRYPEFAGYRRRTKLFIPFLL